MVPGSRKETAGHPRDHYTVLGVRKVYEVVQSQRQQRSHNHDVPNSWKRPGKTLQEGYERFSELSAQPLAATNNPKEDASSPLAAREVTGTDNTTVNIGLAMNHVNDKEKVHLINPNPVQVNEVEEMDTQEGETQFLHPPPPNYSPSNLSFKFCSTIIRSNRVLAFYFFLFLSLFLSFLFASFRLFSFLLFFSTFDFLLTLVVFIVTITDKNVT